MPIFKELLGYFAAVSNHAAYRTQSSEDTEMERAFGYRWYQWDTQERSFAREFIDNWIKKEPPELDAQELKKEEGKR